jgi:hypothetical protein
MLMSFGRIARECERPCFSVQKAANGGAKGHVLQAEMPSFGQHLIVAARMPCGMVFADG